MRIPGIYHSLYHSIVQLGLVVKTAMDLREIGMEVHLICDAISSQR